MVCSGNSAAAVASTQVSANATGSGSNSSSGGSISSTAVPQIGGAWLEVQPFATFNLASSQELTVGDVFGSGIRATLHSLWVSPQAWECSKLAALVLPGAYQQPFSSAATSGAGSGLYAALPEQGPQHQSDASINSIGDGSSGDPGAVLLPDLVLPVLQPLPNTAPTIDSASLSSADVFIGEDVLLSLSATDSDGDPMQAKVTWFGVPAANCSTAGCGDRVAYAASPAASNAQGLASLQLLTVVSYKRAGRYVVRVEVSDGRGGHTVTDLELLVRKLGDTQREARCCRQTGILTAGQNGRPISSTVFRDPLVQSYAAALGWPMAGGVGKVTSTTSTSDNTADDLASYLDHEDLEAERLFDWGILAPPRPSSIADLIVTISCADTRIAGAGSPKVLALTPGQYSTNYGHNKRVLFLPQVRGQTWGWGLAVPSVKWGSSLYPGLQCAKLYAFFQSMQNQSHGAS